MKVFDLDKDKDLELNNGAYIGLGNFDGIHIAHKKILDHLVSQSKTDDMKTVVLLFKEHTLHSLNREQPKVLTSLNQKIEILESIGVEQVYLIDFDNIKSLEPIDFIEKFLIKKLNVKGIFVGFDYKFGKNAEGNIKTLNDYSKNHNLKIFIQESIKIDGDIVSSTLIKNEIENNNLTKAEKLLGRPYYITGEVINGKKLGKKLGYPTANIKLLVNYALPKEGVYNTEIIVRNKSYKAATSLGKNITFNEKIEKIEAHILNFDELIYGERISIRFIEKIREMLKFDTLDELTLQLQKDVLEIGNS